MPLDPESVVGTLCLIGSHGSPAGGKLCLVGKVRELPYPSMIALVGQVHELDVLGKITLTGQVHQVSHEGRITIVGAVHQVSYGGSICLVSVVRELSIPIGPHGIPASTPAGVLPQTGSAIFTSWQEMTAKEILVHRHWDVHEGARLNFDANRKGWRLEMNVTGEKQAEVAAFFVNHVWAGKSFYFYDLQANGFQYDATGVLLTGRYKVRFVDENFPRYQISAASGESTGGRFTIPFSIIEVD